MSWHLQNIWIFAFLLLVSCKDKQAPTQPSSTSTVIGITQAKTLLDSKKVIALDVRTPGEIEKGKIEGALEIDFRGDAFETKLAQLDKSKSYLVYCKSGGRSANTIKLLDKLGFTNSYDMEGGYTAWSKTYGKN